MTPAQPALPVLYSFRRCPYAMRARMALSVSAQAFEHREILLRDKPAAMLAASPKGTVPVLVLPDGRVIDESLDIMLWALNQNDPQNWLEPNQAEMCALVAQCDGPFKQALDAYKYARATAARESAREAAWVFVAQLESRLTASAYLFSASMSLADAAIMPFMRQFAAVEPSWFSRQPLPGVQRWLAAIAGSSLFDGIMQKRAVWRVGQQLPNLTAWSASPVH